LAAGTQSHGFLQHRLSRDWVRFEKDFLADAAQRREGGIGFVPSFFDEAPAIFLRMHGTGLSAFPI
jgi:hypothetical protein